LEKMAGVASKAGEEGGEANATGRLAMPLSDADSLQQLYAR
jgi:hypothetical protein